MEKVCLSIDDTRIPRKKQRGQVLLLVTLSLSLTFAAVGLVVDVGWSYFRRQACQNAAGSAAIAAAQAASLMANPSCTTAGGSLPCQSATACPSTLDTPSNPIHAACLYAQQNGFTNGANGGRQAVLIATNTSGSPVPGVTPSYWASATVVERNPVTFLSVLGQTWGTVAARSTAGVAGSNNCIYSLDPSSSGALHVNSGDHLISSCGVVVNSSNSTGTTIDNGGTVEAPSFSAVGSYSGNVVSTKITTGIAPVTDPLAYLPAPAVGACSAGHSSQYSLSSGSVTLDPGVYCGGINLSGTANVTLNPGIYILNNGGMQLGGNSVLTGTGVMIYNTYSGGISNYAPLNIQDLASLRLVAPTSGTYAGIAFFNDRTVPLGAGGGASIMGGGTTSKIQGTLYFPSVRLEISNGQMQSAAYTIVVAYQLAVTNNQFTVSHDYSSLANGNPIKGIVMYE